MALNTRIVERDPRELRLLEVNARYFRKEQYDVLVKNIQKDGALTSVPLVYPADGDLVISGNHRVQASIDAGLTKIPVMEVLDEQSRDELIARQLSHNAINGEDDPATLKALYDQIEDVDWRDYSGLDDKTLELMSQVDVSGLAEANLEFAAVHLIFLPEELERARAALKAAEDLVGNDEKWLAARKDYATTLDALLTARDSYRIGNVATAFGVLIDVFENNLTATMDGFVGPDGEATRNGWAPLEVVLGTRLVPADVAAVLNKAIDRLVKVGDVPTDTRWKALEYLAANFLAEPEMGA